MAEFDPDAYLATEKKKTGFDPDAYLAKTQPTTTARKEQGKALVSLADSALNFITGGLDMAAYVPARAYYGLKGGMTQEEAAARAQQESTSPKDIIGTYLGYKGQPTYENSPVKQAGEYVGQQLGENVIQPVAQATGIPEPDVGFATNVAMMAAGAVAPKVVAPIKPVIKSGMEFGKGAYSGAFNTTAPPTANPGGLKPWQTRSARMPVGETYIPADILEQYRSGTLTPGEAVNQARPITELPQDALARTQGMVPYAGENVRAAGEQFGAGYRDPYKLAAEVGADYLLGGVPTAARFGLKALDAYKLNKAYKQLNEAGFSPLTAGEFSELNAAGSVKPPQTPPPTPQGGMPQTPPPTPQPQGGAPTQAVQTPAAQAAAATTQAKASQWGASANYDINSGAGNVKVDTPMGPMNVKFNSKGQPEPTGAAVPQAEPQVQPTGTNYNVPTQPVPQVKPYFRPMPAQTKINMPTQGPAVPMPMEPITAPISEPQFTGYKVAEAPTFTKVQKQLEPHANTPLIEKALADKIAANPELTEFSKPYITPQNLKQPIGDFLNNITPSIVAEGGPGTGKSSLAQEWKRLNPQSHLVKITANSLKDSKTLNTILEKAQTQANDGLLFLIDEVDTFTNPGKSTALKHLTTLKTEMDKYGNNAKFLYTTNHIDQMPKLAQNIPVVKVNTKLSPEERSTYAFKIARDYNVNKTPAEIEAIAADPALTNFRDIKTKISEGYSLKEPPIFSYSKSAAKSMPNTPEKITSALDSFVKNELDRNVMLFDASAYAKDSQLSAKLKAYVPKNSSEFNVNDISERLNKGNTSGGDPIRIVINKDNIDDVRALKSEFETGNDKLHPWNFILEDPNNLLTGKTYLPLRSRAHIIDSKMWNNTKPAVNAKAVDVAKAIQRGEDLGIVKSPKTEPVVFKGKTYNSGAEMRKDLIKQKTSPYDIDKLMNKYFPGE